jgi:rhamnose utilization protein RhaD (predicted bifunctional aldolase and dehydrogenase)
LDLSARIGGEPLLVQAGTGNTSIKIDGVLWIKASGKWLAHAATEDILLPVNLAETRRRVDQNLDPAGQTALVGGRTVSSSVETAMHAVLPHRVVLHVHSVNTISFAVRQDGPQELASRLAGLRWQWMPYVASGLPLAKRILEALSRDPGISVLVLANHGLVVCGDDCAQAEALLREVERRVAVVPRPLPEPAWDVLARFASVAPWRAPQSLGIQSLGADPVSRRIVSSGVLYPCQAIFLTPQARVLAQSASEAELAGLELSGIDEPFVLVENAGTLLHHKPNPTELATLHGLVQVLQRIPEGAPVQYLTEPQVRELLCADVYHYRELVEDNGAASLAFPGMLGSESAGINLGAS